MNQFNLENYKKAIYDLKPFLENLKVTNNNFQKILYLLSLNRYKEVSGDNIVDEQKEQEELASFLNSLKSFKNFQVGVIKTDILKIGINNIYCLYLKKHTPYQTNLISKDYNFINEYGELMFYQKDDVMEFNILEGFIHSNNEIMHKAMANRYSRMFVHNVLSNTKKYYKNLEKEEITNKINDSLDKLNLYLIKYLNQYDRNTFYSDFLSNQKRGDEKLGLNIKDKYLKISITDFENYLPDFRNYLPYLLIPRKIDPLALDVAKKYFSKLGEFEQKMNEEFKNSSEIEQKRTDRLLDVIFNQVIIINKHQEFAIKEQSQEGQELYDFIVDKLPKRAKNKNLENKKTIVEFKELGFSEQINIEVNCCLKDFTEKTGLTKDLFKNYLKNLKALENNYLIKNRIPKTPVYFIDEKDKIKFGINIILKEEEELEKDYQDFYALALLETVINVLLKYQQVYNKDQYNYIDMNNFIIQIDIDKLKQELRAKNLFENLINLESQPVLKNVKNKI